jgi:2,4-dienoyl-CoA reductase-like NADH-dependent reductase (Old Yellow Enzyme family)
VEMSQGCIKDYSSLRLLTPITVGGVRIKNRLGLSPLNTGLFDIDGFAGSKCLSFYGQYCNSGIGLIYIGGVAVTSAGRTNRQTLVLDSAKVVPELRKVTDLAHGDDVCVIIQLEHAGR